MRKSLLIGTCFLIIGNSHPSWTKSPDELQKNVDLVITATKTPHILEEIPVETIVVKKEDIENSSVETISDILRYTPGIFVKGDDVPGNTNWKASMRGLRLNDGYGLILIDGERVRGEGMGDSGIGLNQIPPQMIEKIEIVKGQSSVLYGSDAIAGVINIITKRIPDRTSYGLEFKYGKHHTNVEYMYWGSKLKENLGILIQAGREESKMGAYGYKKTRKESFKRPTLITKLAYNINENIKFDLKLSAQEETRKIRYLNKDAMAIKDENKYRISPKITAILEDGSALVVHGYYYDWHLDGDSSGSYPYAIYKGDIYYRDIETRYTKPIGENHLLTLGTEYLQQKLDYTYSNKTLNSISGYFQDEINFEMGIPVSAVIGSRLEHHSQYGSEFCPKINIMFKPLEDTKLRLSAGKGFKSPTIRQAFYTSPYPHGSYFYVSNPDLKAETSWGYSLGIEKNLSDRFSGNVTFYRNDIKDMITRYYDYMDIDGDGTKEKIRTFKNTDKAFTEGIETYIQFTPLEDSQNKLSINIGYTYTHTKNKTTGEPLDDIPKHNITTRITFNYKPLKTLLNIDVQYASKVKEIDSYSVVDIKLIRKLGRYSSISIEGNNIFNSDYGEDPDKYWGATWFINYRMNF